jgi:hypothetical protein
LQERLVLVNLPVLAASRLQAQTLLLLVALPQE